ncbi:MAG: M81 family metallopeptidase [Zavarzinella sp.]
MIRIGVGGLMHESNTFSSATVGEQQFREGSLTTGDQLLATWENTHHELGGAISACRTEGAEVIPLCMAWATPSGIVEQATFDRLCEQLFQQIAQHRPDGVVLALHGAMVTENCFSGDLELVRRFREKFGYQLPLAVTLDFHANNDPQIAQLAQIIVGYQTYPHVDQFRCGELAGKLLVRTLRGEIQPVSAVATLPLIINLLGQATEQSPMREIMVAARTLEQENGVLAASVFGGYYYADVPNMGPSVVVVTDGKYQQAEMEADLLAEQLWAQRFALNVIADSPEVAVSKAVASQHPNPKLLIDLGDNIGGGSAGDGTTLLAELLAANATGWLVVLYDPQAVALAEQLGIGGTFSGAVGAKSDDLHGKPIPITGTVRSIDAGTWEELQPRHGGKRYHDQGKTVVLQVGENNLLVINSLRTPPFSLGQLTSLGIDPSQRSIIVVKAAVAYKAAYAELHPEIIHVNTPGLTAIDPKMFHYQRIRRPIFPLDGTTDV